MSTRATIRTRRASRFDLRSIARYALLALVCCLAAGLAQAQALDEPQFDVRGYEIEGELPIPRERALAVLAPYTGPAVTLSQLRDAAKALETALAESGYPFYRVILPAQTAENIVKLRVLTFRLGNVSVKGNRHFSTANVLRSLPALRREATNVSEVARNRAAVNEHPSKNVEVNFVQSEKVDAVDAEVSVQDEKPVRFFVGLNNFGSPRTGAFRATVGLQHANLWDRDHSLTATFTTSPGHTDDVKQYGFYYRLPVYEVGGALTLFYAHSDVSSGVIANAFQVSGRGTFVGLHWRQHLVPIGAYAHGLELAIDDRLFENDVVFAGTQLGVNVRTRPVTLGYYGRLERVRWSAGGGVQYARNFGGGGVEMDDAAYTANRAGATRHWDALRASLDGVWRVQPITFVARVRAQYSDDNLIPGEQFGLGGAASVRGLREREVTGDSGVLGTVEMLVPLPWTGFSFAAFVDSGYVSFNDPVAGQARHNHASSVGAGLRWAIARRAAASVDAAYLFDGTSARTRGATRVHASIVYWF